MEKPVFLHVSKFDAAGVIVPWVVHEHDMAKIKAQIARYPAMWASRLAAEWDLSEETARRIIKGVQKGWL